MKKEKTSSQKNSDDTSKNEQVGKNICICIAHNFSHFQSEFVTSLMSMVLYFNDWQKHAGRNDSLSFLVQGGIRLDKMRDDVVEGALNSNQDYLVLFDTDMAFPQETLRWMLEDMEMNEDQGVEIITGIYHWKKPPYLPHVYSHYDEKNEWFDMAGHFPLDRLFQVAAAATGCLMVKREVFEKVEKPWFLFENDEDGNLKMGEDLYFFRKTKPITLCDPRILCDHFKTQAINTDTYLSYNGLEKDEDGNFTATPEQIQKIAGEHGQDGKPNL